MNQIISRLGAAAVAVPVFLFAVCRILPANYDLPGWRHFGGER